MSRTGRGIAAMVGATCIWGVSGVLYFALSHVPPWEILAHRTLWSVAFLTVLLARQGRIGEAARILAARRARTMLALSATLIAVNWFVFIFSVQTGHALDASLGYYIFPLIAALLGFFVQGERFGRIQSVALGLALLAVVVLTAGLGRAPWIALVLSTTFGFYGLVKARLDVGPVISVGIETLLLAPLALCAVFLAHTAPGTAAGWFGRDAPTTVLLIVSGPITALPLVLMSYAVRRVAYTQIGLIQYLNPTIQFSVAVAVFGEIFTRWHAIAFPLIWAALALYTTQTFRQERRVRKRARTAGTSATGSRNAGKDGSANP